MILLIDNYDSFTYNLVQYLGEIGHRVVVRRNDRITLSEIREMKPTHIIISPGPCTPNEAGISLDVVRFFAGKIPILGVCLGHQVIGQAFGGKVIQDKIPVHGKTSLIYHDGQGIYKGLPNPFRATRYHSLVVDKEGLPQELIITATTAEGTIMGIRHRTWAVEGVQFHPESIMTEYGKELLLNFLEYQA
ncbi:glutamine amidotransferase [Carboxydothermus islandicus]|uniref:Glutamine amidotransferase n=1 Tax=Carboxydothermus islandicus TaxID=661089 RepID=A0A1L8D1X0_9THEO|nr:aminodeoxychorismate/anthranilate synthase component II [Carboxydothermus islandicus]GAV25107.1 glutamine amidotransferase [Carboxydothermus islandicus]